jgi:FdrA protein
MKTVVRIHRDTYLDSVLQLAGARAMREAGGVDWAAAAMGTPSNVEELREQGVDPAEIADASANDLVLAVRAASDADIENAFTAGERAMFGQPGAREASAADEPPPSLEEALRRQADSTVAIVSVPGDYAALEAHKALARGLDVLLFSDNVAVADEIALKEHAARRGRFVMGPGAGTALLGGVGLGFANVVRPGPVGVIAAAGTGAQEAMALLDRWGVGVSHVVGLGGRDLSEEVGGRMAALALAALRDDPATEVILLVSKPPARSVAERVLALAGDTPLVAALVGLDAGGTVPTWRASSPGCRRSAPRYAGCTPGARCASRRSSCSAGYSGRYGRTPRSTSGTGCRHPRTRASVWTWARRSTRKAGRIR